MQIFVKWFDGKTLTLDVDASDSILNVKNQLHLRKGAPVQYIRIIFKGKQCEDEITLSDYGIVKESTLHAAMRMGAKFEVIKSTEKSKKKKEDYKYDPAVKTLLEIRLEALKNKRHFVFIGKASYAEHSDSRKAVLRQQCPVEIFSYCVNRPMPLAIVLVDPSFVNGPESEKRQLYDHEPWKLKFELYSGKVRHYALEEHEFKLSTYATCIFSGEWAGTAITLAGVDLVALGKGIAYAGGHFVAGNFYAGMTGLHIDSGGFYKM